MTESSFQNSKWRQRYKVHPAADVFPMMSDDELAELGKDIKKNGLSCVLTIAYGGILLDGRNRLEAMERAGVEVTEDCFDEAFDINEIDPVAFVIGRNIHRRHLTKAQQAELIVAALKAGEKLDQAEPVSKGGRGKKSKLKEKAVGAGKEHDISEATIKRAMAKAELTPEEIEARRKKYQEQAARRDEQTRERREEKVARARQRESDVAEALAILGHLDLDMARRLVTLLMDEGTICDVSMALVDKENERDDARAELDELLEAEAEAAP